MQTTLLIIYLLVILIIIVKIMGVILIFKGFINKIQKQWVNGFILLGLAFILTVTAAAIGINQHLNCKAKRHELKMECYKNGCPFMHKREFKHCKAFMKDDDDGEMEDYMMMNSKMDSLKCKVKMEMCKKKMEMRKKMMETKEPKK